MKNTVDNYFKIEWKDLNIIKKESKVMLATGSKRDPVYDNDNNWVDTRPKDVTYEDTSLNSQIEIELVSGDKILNQEKEKKSAY